MTVDEILSRIDKFTAEGKEIVASSSFQTQSAPLLHILSQRNIKICFLNTGFHFPETIAYKNRLTEHLKLDLFEVASDISKLGQIDSQGRYLHETDPDKCCKINKVLPMESVLADYDIWISGVRADQTQNRKKLETEMSGPNKTLRFHPMLDWSKRDIYSYVKEFNLPRHPLEMKGVESIGCQPCTSCDFNSINDGGRDSRWKGLGKNECGLHTELIKKQKI